MTAGGTPISGRAVRFANLLLENHLPLHQRVPTRDEAGRLLTDFMVLIPGLRDRSGHEFNDILSRLQAIMSDFSEVVFVDLNLPLNLLWVSLRPRAGVILELFGVLQHYVPEARLIGHHQE